MKLKSLLALVAVLVSSAGFSSAALAADYQTLPTPVPVEARGKIEVIEFFSYGCNHCADFDPMLEKWVKGLPKDVVFRRIPLAGGRWEPYARIFFTLEAMNLLPAVHAEVFKALHVERKRLSDENDIFDWVATKGVDRAKFAATYKSFSIQNKILRAPQLAAAYGIEGVPTLVVQGKYKPEGKSFEDKLRIADQLIAKTRSEGKK